MQLQSSILLPFLAVLSSTTSGSLILRNADIVASHADAADASTAAAAPAQAPWLLSNITIFQAKPTTAGASYLRFTFTDTRKGLKLTTDCRRLVLSSEVPGINDSAHGYTCANNTVAFTYSQGKFDIVRNYRDASVGPPGMDNVIAYGGATATLTTTSGGCGLKQTLGSLPAQITAMVA